MELTIIFFALIVTLSVVAAYILKTMSNSSIRAIFHWLLTTLYRVKVKGLENYHQAGERVVIVANHSSLLDAILLATFLPDKLTVAVNTLTAKQWWIRLSLRLVDAFQIEPTHPLSIKSLIEFIKRNNRCVVFPEGRFTATGALMKFFEGPGLIADKAHAKLLPIRIEGAQFTPFSLLRGKVRIRWLPSITITIFPPQTLDVAPELTGRKRRQKLGYKLHDIMMDTMFKSSDYYQTLFESLIDAKITHGRRHPIIEDIDRKPVNYQQLITRSFILGNIIAKSTQPGEAVGVLLPNAASSAIVFFALQAYCRVPAMLNYSTGINNVMIACQTAQIKTVYTSLKFVQVGKLQEMIDALTQAGVKVVYLERLRTEVTWRHILLGAIMAQFPEWSYKLINSAKKTRHLLNPDTHAVILFTSGSEGTPKGVVLSHLNLQSNRCQLQSCVDFTPNDSVLNALPIFHSFGLTGGMLLPILSGVKVFFYPSPLHYRVVPQLSYDINATILFGTDTFLSGYAKYAHQYDFYSIRYVFAGAEKLRDETHSTWSQKFGVRIFEGYGATETAPVLATNTPMQNKMGTVGRLLPGISYQLKPVPGIDDGGVLMVSGPNIMKGYLLASNPGVLVAPEQGWYETGDVVSIDENGFVTIKGRIKRFAKIAGEMVSLTMVEQQISKLWPDHQHAVVNLPDPKKGEQIILITTNMEASRDAIVSHAKVVQMGEIAIPRKIISVPEMPLLGTGKIDYNNVKKLAEASTGL